MLKISLREGNRIPIYVFGGNLFESLLPCVQLRKAECQIRDISDLKMAKNETGNVLETVAAVAMPSMGLIMNQIRMIV